MKTISTTLILFLLAAGASTSAHAQGPFQFTADLRVLDPLPGQEVFGGQGTFSLEGNLFRYRVVIAPYWPVPDGAVHGPGLDGPVLFDLAFLGCQTPLGTNLGSCVFRGTLVVPDSQIVDLLANEWYVRASIHGDGDVNYAGRIELVPEPSLTALLCVGALVSSVCFCIRLRRRRAHFPTDSRKSFVAAAPTPTSIKSTTIHTVTFFESVIISTTQTQ